MYTLGMLAVAGGLGAAMVLSSRHQSASASGVADFAKSMAGSAPHGSVADAIAQRLAKEPCDRQEMLNLAAALAQAGDQRAVIDRAEAFWKACGPFPRLHWYTMRRTSV